MVTDAEANAPSTDEGFMRRAVGIAEKAKRRTAPNPWVGAVIVASDGKTILGEGYHHGPGQAHGEVEAFRDADKKGVTEEQLKGATIYTTLEPCHRGPGKRTPPCDELVCSRKVRRCVIGKVDPDPTFGGAGVQTMKEAGVQVDVGIAEFDVQNSLRSYFHQRSTGTPYVVVKIATSLDGCIGCADKTSQWITGPQAREDAGWLRADSQAILVGSETAIKDKPRLTVRVPGDPDMASPPLRVVLDTKGRVRDGPLMDTTEVPTLIMTSKEHCPEDARSLWSSKGLQVCDIPLDPSTSTEEGPRLNLEAVLKELAKRGVMQLMVEGGAVLQGELIKRNLVQELRVYIGATLLGSSAQSWARTPLTSTISDAKFWKLRTVRQLGNDVCMEYEKAETA
mmetsp:Transcript_95335/g.208508  ORF Transcript_95335/g.208508 Transcript_95335/m.208508 type:complete len:395 (+) Transcript_95335:33-1217(+)